MTSNESLSVFEKMITDISNPSGNTDLLDECMAFRPDMIKKIPLRFRLIALGFPALFPKLLGIQPYFCLFKPYVL